MDRERLYLAIKNGDTPTVIGLLDMVDPALDNNLAMTLAIQGGHRDIVDMLLNDVRIDVNDSMLKEAVDANQPAIVSLLLREPLIDPAFDDNYAIKKASEMGYTDIVRILLSDSRIDPEDSLILAIQNNHLGVVRQLLNDIRTNVKANDNQALMTAVYGYGIDYEIVRELIRSMEVDITARNNAAIRKFITDGDLRLVQLVFEETVLDPAFDDNTPLALAANFGHHDIVAYLLRQRNVVENIDPSAEYVKLDPLILEATYGNTINAGSIDRMTPLDRLCGSIRNMGIKQLRQLARDSGIDPTGMSKSQLCSALTPSVLEIEMSDDSSHSRSPPQDILVETIPSPPTKQQPKIDESVRLSVLPSDQYLKSQFSLFKKSIRTAMSTARPTTTGPKSKIIDIVFNGEKETIDIINTGGDLIAYLTRDNQPVCPLMGKIINKKDEIGKGSFGTVYKIDMNGAGIRDFVVKAAPIRLIDNRIYTSSRPQTVHELGLLANKERGIPYDLFVSLNGEDPDRVIRKDMLIVLPLFASACRTGENIDVPRVDGRGVTRVPSGTLMCDRNEYAEFALSLLTGTLKSDEVSINFFNTFMMSMCFRKNLIAEAKVGVRSYIFMEKVNDSLRKTGVCPMQANKGNHPYRGTSEHVYIQCLHAIAVYQKYFQIVHGDLHDDNIFVEYVTNDTMWNGKKLLDYEVWEYKVGDRSVYLPRTNCIVKIGDWGLACKYSEPMILNSNVMANGHDQGDGNGAWLPNFYSTAYDVVFLTFIMFRHNISDLFRKAMAWILRIDSRTSREEIMQACTGVFYESYRPNVSLLETRFSHVNPQDILRNRDIMGPYSFSLPIETVVLGTV